MWETEKGLDVRPHCNKKTNRQLQPNVMKGASDLFQTFLSIRPSSGKSCFFSLQMKSKQKNEGSVGLYTYPVLQAADILLYKYVRLGSLYVLFLAWLYPSFVFERE